MSVTKSDRELGGGGGSREREKSEDKRSRALSCRPGSQISRGLKSGVDCVEASSVGE